MQFTLFLLNYTYSIICVIMGFILFLFPKPKSVHFQNYNISIKILGIAYISMALFNLIFVIYESFEEKTEYFDFFLILTSSLQAILFAYTLITLFNPLLATKQKIFKQLTPLFIFTFAYLLSFLSESSCTFYRLEDFLICIKTPAGVIRISFFLFYFFQLIYFSSLIFNESKKYKIKLENFFSETSKLELKWVNYAFYFALFIGLFALVSQAIPNKMMNIIFTIILCIYYFLFALKYLNYSTIIKILPENNIADNEEHEQRTNYSTKIEWSFLKNEILEKKYYLKIGITLEDLASTLKVGRTTLSNLINKEEGVNFNTWINKLRIEVAKKILIEKNTYTLQEVSEMVGYSEQSNFSKQFKIFTKKTPSEWKKKNFT